MPIDNGNYSPNDVTSPGGGLPFLGGNNTILGQLGSGNANQFGNGNGTIVNDQFRLFTGLTQPQPPTPPTVVQQIGPDRAPQPQTAAGGRSHQRRPRCRRRSGRHGYRHWFRHRLRTTA